MEHRPLSVSLLVDNVEEAASVHELHHDRQILLGYQMAFDLHQIVVVLEVSSKVNEYYATKKEIMTKERQ